MDSMTRLALIAPLLLLASCTCNGGDPNACPKEFRVGDPCKNEGQTCLYPGTKCGLANCTCKNLPGGFSWECESGGNCACICPCGRLAYGSCESLECSKPQDKCPETPYLQTICKQAVCMDLGPPDRGPDVGKKDGRTDGPRPDIARDASKDASRDTSTDAPVDRGADASRDTRADAPADIGADASVDLPGAADGR
jgi:hypothetical protein